MLKLLLQIVFLCFLIIIGSYLLFFANSVQSYALRAIEIGVSSRSQWLREFVQSSSYIAVVRAVGIITYLMAVVLIFALFRGT